MSRRRGRGEDSIYRDGDRWRGAIDLGHGPDGRRIRKKVSGRTKAEVVQKLREIRRDLTSGAQRPDDRLTVAAYLDRWVRVNLDGQVSAKTRDSYADTVRLHLKPGLGRIVVRQLTVAQVDALWRHKREQGYSANSIRIMRAVLRRALTQAEREGIVNRNVAALSGAPRVSAKEGRALTVDQARQLLAALDGHRYEVLIAVMLAFGLRRGEALGLHWTGVDLDAATLGVRHTVKRVQDTTSEQRKTRLVVADEAKTKRSRRILFLTPELVLLLRRHKARQAEERIAAGSAWQDHGLVFATEIGTPIDPDNFSHGFSRLTKRAGLGHWHPHELRHSGASLMLAQGTDLYVVSEILGHSSIAITKDVYGHLVEGHKREASEAMTRALFGGSGSQIGSQGGDR